MLNFDRSTAKDGTQNIQNDCHQWLPGSFRVHQIRFRPGPGPHCGSLHCSPRPLAGLRGPASKGEGEGRERGNGDKERAREREGPPPPLSKIPGSPPEQTPGIFSPMPIRTKEKAH